VIPELAIIIPAFNEGPRLAAVLEPLRKRPEPWEVLVVNDASTDNTAAVARAFPGVRVIDLQANHGKGGAVLTGARATSADLVVLLDADLAGVGVDHLRDLLRPVQEGEADMTVALFRGGRGFTDWSHVLIPWISGQRAIRRERLLSAPHAAEVRYGIEAVLTRHARREGWRTRYVHWHGVTQAVKEEKLGFVPGFIARMRMYIQIGQGWLAAGASGGRKRRSGRRRASADKR
jgi:glycosyltransferase involved in cell wall biosynthesis